MTLNSAMAVTLRYTLNALAFKVSYTKLVEARRILSVTKNVYPENLVFGSIWLMAIVEDNYITENYCVNERHPLSEVIIWQILRDNWKIMRNGMLLIESRIRAFDWYQNQWPWMTLKLNGVMAVAMRYFTEFNGVMAVDALSKLMRYGSWAFCWVYFWMTGILNVWYFVHRTHFVLQSKDSTYCRLVFRD